jgi:nucleoside-diphosphate-sugar epimerase
VTGAAGFIGRRLVPMLRERGHEVHRVLRPDGESDANADSELRDSDTKAPIASVDSVIHLAQSPHHRDFPESALHMVSVNVTMTARLLDFARRAGAKSFVLASTGGVYGAASSDENAAVRPRDFYCATKVAAETLLWPYATHLRATALRLFTPYGPGQRNRLIPALIERVRSGRAVSLDGDEGGLVLSPTFVDDVAATFIDAVEKDWEGIFNVAAPKQVSIRDVARAIGRLVGKEPVFERSGRPESRATAPDLRRIRARRDVDAFVDLDRGLSLTLEADR